MRGWIYSLNNEVSRECPPGAHRAGLFVSIVMVRHHKVTHPTFNMLKVSTLDVFFSGIFFNPKSWKMWRSVGFLELRKLAQEIRR